MSQMRKWMQPVIIYGLTVDAEYSFGDAVRCLTLFAYYEFGPEDRIPDELWQLYSMILFEVGGDSDEFGPAFDDINSAIIACQVFIAKDPHTLQSMAA